MDLEPFGRINPCGYAGLQVTSVLDLGGPSGMDAVKPVLLDALARQFGLRLQPVPAFRNFSLPPLAGEDAPQGADGGCVHGDSPHPGPLPEAGEGTQHTSQNP